ILTGQIQVLQAGAELATYQQIEKQVIVVPEPITNKLLISTTTESYRDVLRIIEELDAQAPMVVIQVLIAEVDLSGTEEFGIEFGLQSPVLFQRGTTGGVTLNGTAPLGTQNVLGQDSFNFNLPPGGPQVPLGNSNLIGPATIGVESPTNLGTGRVSPNSGIGGFVFSAANESFNLLIRALKQQGRVDILSRPQVMTLDNQEANIQVGQQVPALLGTTLAATGLSQQNITYIPTGVNLRVTAKISPDAP